MTNRTAATRYARALLDVVVSEQLVDPELVERELTEFVALFTGHATLQQVMLNPAVPTPRKREVMAELVARAAVSPALGKLLLMLASRDRLVLLPDLLAAYRDRLLDHRHVVRADVTTAVPLAEDRARVVEGRLAQLTGRTVVLTAHVDPAIIGGVVARIGSTVYDGSVTRQLQKMKEKLVERV